MMDKEIMQERIAANEAQNCAHELRDVVRSLEARIEAALKIYESPFGHESDWGVAADEMAKALRSDE